MAEEAQRMVRCCKFGKDMPGLDKPPLPGEIGQTIYERVSAQAWALWRDDMQMKVLNEYRLNMGNPDDYATLMRQMLLFLMLEEGELVEVENEERGREGS